MESPSANVSVGARHPTTICEPFVSTSALLPIQLTTPFLNRIWLMSAGFPSNVICWLPMRDEVPGSRAVSGSTSCFQRTWLGSLALRPSQLSPPAPASSKNGDPCTFISNTYCLQSELTKLRLGRYQNRCVPTLCTALAVVERLHFEACGNRAVQHRGRRLIGLGRCRRWAGRRNGGGNGNYRSIRRRSFPEVNRLEN